MILALNIGNSNITFGSYTPDGKLVFSSRLFADTALSSDELLYKMVNMLALYGAEPQEITAIIFSSVVPALTPRIREALRKMCANIQVYRECLGGTPCRFGQKNYYHSAVISGPTPLHSADIEVPDLRGGFSHLIAALAASGTSTVSGIDVISRGYEHFTRKLHQLDARVRYLDA